MLDIPSDHPPPGPDLRPGPRSGPRPAPQKRFQCQHCQRLFARLEHLQRHERTHTQEKPFGCRQCQQRFTRSDLLIRHQRLSHTDTRPQSNPRGRRKRTAQAAGLEQDSIIPPVSFEPVHSLPLPDSHSLPLETLSLAAEHAALQGITSEPGDTRDVSTDVNMLPFSEPDRLDRDLPSSDFDSLAAFLDNGLASHHFSSFISAEQPIPFFSPESIVRESESEEHHLQTAVSLEESSSFSRFGSRLPSLQPEESPSQREQRKPLSDVSVEDRQLMAAKLDEFACVVPPDFQLPSWLALSRYLAGYINGFHEHMPCLHIQTMSVQTCAIELLLAMAAVGAQYCFEGEKGVELFHVSQEIAMRRIRRRDARVAQMSSSVDSDQSPQGNQRIPSISGPLGLPQAGPAEDLMQTAQALFLLMAMATWAKHKEILREALAIQSILATLVREDGLKMEPLGEDVSWEDWIRHETVKRTKFIVFCFFNLHCIVYNIPSLILSSEVHLPLPCSAAEFKAPTAARWKEARKRSHLPEPDFQTAFHRLFAKKDGGSSSSSCNSSLGNYVLIHALIQHIFFVRQIARCRNNHQDDPDEMTALEQALRNWQLGWKQNPESSLDPLDPNGPVAFNSTALLRLAYIRLNNIDIGPGHALATRDPIQIAHSFRDSPATGLRRTRKLVRAVLHSAHALSIPVKIGIRLVARTQTFTWSIQHSLCSLECAFLLCKWLEALALPDPQPEVSEDERRICWLVKTMLDETEYGVKCEDDRSLRAPSTLKQLSAGVLRVWAQIFKGAQTWAIVDIIGSALNIYADMLCSSGG
ncbi:hypothetical protein VTN77DRAFT_4452 [Rasamsonia byssochlamydoides]|uniref:uncharacterized protein n=1 Tax=Rasamsonia byssochlamydoides TaxID=89139 RepID=UPI003744616C